MASSSEASPSGNAAPRHDWSARARTTALQALRYTRFVGVMKRALPAAAFAVIAAVVAFFFVARQPAKVQMGYERLGRIQNDLAMVKPRLTGVDGKGNPFVITADAAVQDAHNVKQVHLKKIEADLTDGKAGWINANAAAGTLDMAAGQLELTGGIDVFSDRGYELHSASVSVDLDKGIVHGHQPVTGHGPMGDLSADMFHFERDTNLLTLTGHVHMTIIGSKA